MIKANPILADATRGGLTENRHRGAYVFCDAAGQILSAAGDVHAAVFPRSAIKAMQALAIFVSGAAQKYAVTDIELALAAASHNAEAEHVAAVEKFLARIGCAEADLECGPQWPSNAKARAALKSAGGYPSAIHNNCSGKHAGMLAVARALGAPLKDYVEAGHPVQQLVRQCMEAVIGVPLSTDRCGVDGCSIPTWAAPLKSFAFGFARMATGQGLDPVMAEASRRVLDAATGHAFYVRGTQSFDTDVMTAFGGRLMVKMGADGVFCGALRDSGVGFALKIDDGSMQAAEIVMAGLLRDALEMDQTQAALLAGFAQVERQSRMGARVGVLMPTELVRTGLRARGGRD